MKKLLIITLSTLMSSGCFDSSSLSTAIYQKSNPNAPFNRDEIVIKKTPKDCEILMKQCKAMGGRFQKKGDVRYKDFCCICLH